MCQEKRRTFEGLVPNSQKCQHPEVLSMDAVSLSMMEGLHFAHHSFSQPFLPQHFSLTRPCSQEWVFAFTSQVQALKSRVSELS